MVLLCVDCTMTLLPFRGQSIPIDHNKLGTRPGNLKHTAPPRRVSGNGIKFNFCIYAWTAYRAKLQLVRLPAYLLERIGNGRREPE